jgi:hypothetical protein
MLKADNVSPIPKELPIEQAGAMPSDALEDRSCTMVEQERVLS